MKGKLKSYLVDIIETRNKRITAIGLFLAAFLCNIIIEICNARSVWKGIIYLFRDPFSFVINYSIITFTLSFCLLLKNHSYNTSFLFNTNIKKMFGKSKHFPTFFYNNFSTL